MTDQPKDELRDIAPDLSAMKNQDGFSVPHNYFKELPDRVLARIHEEEQKPSPVDAWWARLWQPRYALAFATVLILVVAGIWITKSDTPTDPLASITGDEALQYVMANLHEFSTEDVLSVSTGSEWEAEEFIRVSDENLDQLIDELLEEGEDLNLDDLF